MYLFSVVLGLPQLLIEPSTKSDHTRSKDCELCVSRVLKISCVEIHEKVNKLMYIGDIDYIISDT